jgi:transcriptional regulator with XRE-family HTH domain
MPDVIDENTALQNIAANIVRRLEELGWSQGELARQSGEKPMTISRMVNAQHMPELPTTANVADALGMTIDALMSEPAKKVRISNGSARKTA